MAHLIPLPSQSLAFLPRAHSSFAFDSSMLAEHHLATFPYLRDEAVLHSRFLPTPWTSMNPSHHRPPSDRCSDHFDGSFPLASIVPLPIVWLAEPCRASFPAFGSKTLVASSRESHPFDVGRGSRKTTPWMDRLAKETATILVIDREPVPLALSTLASLDGSLLGSFVPRVRLHREPSLLGSLAALPVAPPSLSFALPSSLHE